MRGCWKPHVVDSSLMTPPIPVSSQAMVHAPRPNGPWTDAVPRWLRFAALALGGAVVASLVEGTFGSLPPHSDTPRTIWRDSVFVTLPTWLVAAAMLPLVLLVARRFPFVRGRMWRAIVVHLVAASAFVMLHLYATASMMRMAHPHARPAWFIVVDLLRLYSVAELLIYVSVVGLWHALFYQRAAIERERDAARLREDLTRARLESLRLQLNPHFLFNTLQAVAVMARTHETDALVGTVQGLARSTGTSTRHVSARWCPRSSCSRWWRMRSCMASMLVLDPACSRFWPAARAPSCCWWSRTTAPGSRDQANRACVASACRT